MAVILLGIDGSGKIRDNLYTQHFRNSFVTRLCSLGRGNRKYLGGPGPAGGGLSSAINEGYEWVKILKRENPSDDILLTGYSRGAVGVIVVANKLKRDGLNVKAMMLFDCVDRHLRFDATFIPENVQNVKHVIRDPASGSRRRFGNDGMRWHSGSTNYLPIVRYMCTHGGMGGTPNKPDRDESWTDLIDEGAFIRETNISYQQDKNVSERIWNDCQVFFRQHGFV
ncbi:MAG: hypothetical protein ACR2MD_09620 [Aridibacter sp.]